MKMDKKLKFRGGGKLNSPLPLDPNGGSRTPFRLAMRSLATIPFLGKLWIRHCMWDLGVKSQKLNTLAIAILQQWVNQKPRKFFSI